MTRPQKGHPSNRSKTKQIVDQGMMGDLAKYIIEVLEADDQKEVEPFESYAHQLRKRMHADTKLFCNRFIQGYESLLEELRSKKPS